MGNMSVRADPPQSHNVNIEPRAAPKHTSILDILLSSIMAVIQAINSFFGGNQTLDPQRVSEVAPQKQTVAKAEAVAQRQKVKKPKKKKKKKAESTPVSRPASPDPMAILTRSREIFAKKEEAKQFAEKATVPILNLATKIREDGTHTQSEQALLQRLHEQNTSLVETHNISSLIEPLTRLENAVQNTRLA